MVSPLAFLFLFLCCLACAPLKEQKPYWAQEGYVQLAWSKNVDRRYLSGNQSVSFNSPTIHQDKLFQGDVRGRFTAFYLPNGRIIWQVDEKMPISGRAVVFEKNVIYGSYSGRVFARDLQTGALDYAIDLGASVEEAPLAVEGRLIFHTRNHSLMALDARSGKILWKYKRAIPFMTTLQNVSRPYYWKGKLYVGFADGHVAAFQLEDGNILWEQKLTQVDKFIDVDMQPFIFKDRLFIGSAADQLKILDPSNGNILFTVDIRTNSAPISYKENLLVGGLDGRVYIIDINGKILYQKLLSEKSITSLNVWNDKLLVATLDGRVHFVQTNGLIVNRFFDLGSEHSAVYGEFAPHRDYLAFLSANSRLYVFKRPQF